MSKIFQKAKSLGKRTKAFMLAAAATILTPVAAAAQSLAGTGYEAGTSAMEEVANQIVAYVPYVVNLCYALAGVVAVVGAISVYIAMNNEEQGPERKILSSQNNQNTIYTEQRKNIKSCKRK